VNPNRDRNPKEGRTALFWAKEGSPLSSLFEDICAEQQSGGVALGGEPRYGQYQDQDQDKNQDRIPVEGKVAVPVITSVSSRKASR